MDANALAGSFPSSIPFPPELLLLCHWVCSHGYPISGFFQLCEHDEEILQIWFGTDQAVGHLAQFGSGPDGSLYCIWRQPDGRMPVVHMGSEGQNNFVLAANAVDFLRLLALGYDEIGFDDLRSPPVGERMNPSFKAWVSETFKVAIPEIGAEITEPAHARMTTSNNGSSRVVADRTLKFGEEGSNLRLLIQSQAAYR